MPVGRLALAAAVRMVARVHDDAADLGPQAHVAGAPGLAEVLVLVVQVRHLADGCDAVDADPPDLAGRQADLGVVAFLGEQLGRRPGRAHDLAALAGHQLDVVDRGAERDVRHRQGIADACLGVGAGHDHVADLQAVRQEHVALLAVAVVKQPDARRAIRVVLDRREARRHAFLVALEIDDRGSDASRRRRDDARSGGRRCCARTSASATRAAACRARGS